MEAGIVAGLLLLYGNYMNEEKSMDEEEEDDMDTLDPSPQEVKKKMVRDRIHQSSQPHNTNIIPRFFDPNTQRQNYSVFAEAFSNEPLPPHLNMHHFQRGNQAQYDFPSRKILNEQKLEKFTGNEKLRRKKREVEPLFQPQPHLDNTATRGLPNFTELVSSRFMPSTLRNNEKPFDEEWVGRGLNTPAHINADVGFHDPYRPLPKTVDELRATSNPKISYGGRIIEGLRYNNRPAEPNVAKNRVERVYTPLGYTQVRHFVDKQKMDENIILPTQNRETTSVEYKGAAQYAQGGKSSIEPFRNGKVALTKRINNTNPHLIAPRPTTEFAPEFADQSTIYTVAQQRDTTNTAGHLISAHNPQINKPRTIDYNDIPDVTRRDLHGSNPHLLSAHNPQLNKPYTIDYNDAPELTRRDVHGSNPHLFSAHNPQLNKPYTVDYNDAPELTKRDVHGTNSHLISAHNPQLHKPYTVDYNDAPELTKRDIHGKNQQSGAMKNYIDNPSSHERFENMNTNARKEHISSLREPVYQSAKMAPNVENVNVALRTPTNYSYHNHAHSSNNNLRLASNYRLRADTNAPDGTNFDRINPYVLASLESNPLVNNVVIQRGGDSMASLFDTMDF